MAHVRIRGYRSEDEAGLLETWNAALPGDVIDARTFRRKVLLDPNFDPDWLLLAEINGEVAAFCLCLIRRVPMEGAGLEPERGWITALGVHPGRWSRGAGSALLDRAHALFREAGRREALLSPYTPNYFVPGVDVVRYARGLAFLERRGFEVISRPLSMDANIVLFEEDRWRKGEGALREEGIEVRGLRPGEIPSLMEFLKAHMPGDWARHAREALLDALRDAGEEPPFIVAVRDAEVVGYCQFEGEHFGPFGVRTDMQGRGIGTLAMARCLAAMRRRGHHNAWVLWTSDEAARRVYDRFGFRETRRFAILRRRL